MKKLFFVSAAAVLLCSSCDWFSNKQDQNNNDGTTLVDDSLTVNPDTTLTEIPDSSADGTQTTVAEKETAEKQGK